MQSPRYLLQCPGCGFIQEQHFTHCGQCSAALQQQCQYCLQFSPIHFQKCGYCGTPHPKSQTIAPPTQASVAPPNRNTGPLTTSTAIARMSERRKAAILFCDICGFTAMSEKLDPEEVSQIIEPLFRRCNQAINRYEGVIEKFIGDALMAVFGTPIAHEDDAERAALAALEIQQIIQDFSAENEARTGIEINMRIGLNLGDIVVGSVEAATGRHYQILGDAINVAARMEQNAEPGQILVTEELHHQLKENFELQFYRAIQAKGKAQPLPSYKLLGLRHLRPRRRGNSRQTPFVGRQAELQQLKAWGLQILEQGRPDSLVLHGVSGIGKTRLAEELYQQLKQTQANLRWLQTHSTSYSQHVNYLLLQNLVRQILDIEINQDLLRSQDKIYRFLKEHQLTEIELSEEILTSLLFPQHELPALQFVPPEHLKQQLFDTVLLLLKHQAQQQPLFICLDDLQWCDSLSLEWLNLLQTQSETFPVLLCLIARTPDSLQGYGQQLELGPLAQADCQQVLLHMLEEDVFPHNLNDLVIHLLQRSQGNVYYLEEGLRHLLAAGQLYKGEGQWQLGADWQTLSLPDSLQSLVLSRVDHLSDELRELLQLLSVTGNQTPVILLDAFFQELSTLPSETLLFLKAFDIQQVEELSSLGFIQTHTGPRGMAASFQQALTQEVIYNALTNRRKQALHHQIGLTLETLYRSDLSQATELLAYHFERSPDALKAVFYLCQAAQQAARFFANQQAIVYYQQALEQLDKIAADQLIPLDYQKQHWLKTPQLRTRIIQWQSEILLLQGAYEAIFAKVNPHLQLTLAPEDRARMLYCKGRALEKHNQYQQARELYLEARGLLDNQPDRQAQARIWNAIGWSSHWLRDYEQAEQACQLALGLLNTHPDMEQIAYAHNVLGVVAFHQHRWEDALQHYQQVLSIHNQIQNLWGQANVLSNLGMTLVKLHHWQQALEVFSESLRLRKQLGDREGTAISLNNLGHIQREQGNLQEAQATLEQAITLYRQLQNPLGLAISRCNLGTVKKLQGQFAEALELLETGIPVLENLQMGQMLPELYLSRIEAYLSSDKSESAKNYLHANQETIQQYGDPLELKLLSKLKERLNHYPEPDEPAQILNLPIP